MKIDLGQWFDTTGLDFRGSWEIGVPDGWTAVEAKLVLANPFLAVVSVGYDTPAGRANNKLDRKELVLRRPAPVAFAVREGELGDEVLLIQQVRHGAGTTVLELPGGMMDVGETPREAAARELSEEGGLKVSPDKLEFLGTIHRDVARSPDLEADAFFVRVDANAPTTTPVAEPGEHIVGRHWALAATLLKEIADGELVDAVLMSAVGIVLARQGLLRV